MEKLTTTTTTTGITEMDRKLCRSDSTSSTSIESDTDNSDSDSDCSIADCSITPEIVTNDADDFPLLPTRWYAFFVLGALAYTVSPYAKYLTAFYIVTWTLSPVADWSIIFQLAKRSFSGRHDGLPLRFNLIGIAILAWLIFVRFPLECVLWYLDEILFSGYKATKVEEPLFILGQPRSGTTKFQDVLSADHDSFCSMYLYEMRFPYLTIQYVIDFFYKMDQIALGGRAYNLAIRMGKLNLLPESGQRKQMRRLRFDLPDEDDNLFLFHGPSHMLMTAFFPSHAKMFYQFGNLPEPSRVRMMKFHQRCVQKMMYRRGHGKRYLCKWVAGWNGLLEQSKQVYPDAKYAVMVRDPREQLPSWLKLQGLLSEQMAGHNVMKIPKVRRDIIDVMAQWHQTQAEFCASSSTAKHIIQFEDFVADIPREVTKLYDFIGLPIQPGSPFHESLLEHRRNQSNHKKTVIPKEEAFISEEEILSRFPPLPLTLISPPQ
ncbi:expressed unknown protein [Seminavis robusta]|uniref:Sulfotransferase n=1 Tax=Seminavis robusta TaxID=568900 RepID=A0A9N8H521_9STRA|nr:expressed unknown protein [Seminavis robusta]|eukprot:Sro16_g011990.1 n/a (488) ;mRNA; r:183062-184525